MKAKSVFPQPKQQPCCLTGLILLFDGEANGKNRSDESNSTDILTEGSLAWLPPSRMFPVAFGSLWPNTVAQPSPNLAGFPALNRRLRKPLKACAISKSASKPARCRPTAQEFFCIFFRLISRRQRKTLGECSI